MSQFVDTKTKTFPADAAIGQYLRVHLSSGQVTLSGATDQDIGTTRNATFAAAEPVAVCLVSGQGTEKMVAAAAISENAKVYGAASGKISSTQATGAFLRGIALEAASADGDVIEVLPLVGDTAGA